MVENTLSQNLSATDQERLLGRAIASSKAGILIADAQQPDFPTLYASPGFEKLIGASADGFFSRTCRKAQDSERQHPEIQKLQRALEARSACSVTLHVHRNKDNNLFWNHLILDPIYNENNEIIYFLCLLYDVTETRRREEETAFHTERDATTGLPRLAQIEEFLQSAFVAVAGQGGRIVVLSVDLDRFHLVNETHGHSVGDQVLRTIADRLSDTVGTSGSVARVASDEFAAALVDHEGIEDQVEFAEKVRAAVESPLEIDDLRIYLTCSIGVSCFPDNGSSPQELLRQAEAAMTRAKREGRSSVCAFSNEQAEELQQRNAIGKHLHKAIRESELVLHYQPQISGQSWQVMGIEAVAQWQSPELGLVSAARFMPVAEALGLIVEIGQWALTTACRQARTWLDAGLGDFILAINVSALQLQRASFVEDVQKALTTARLPPRYLELELTEGVVMNNVERVIDTMRALKAIGVVISMDGVGTGYSSLNYLRRFPIDKLKIDPTFVTDITVDSGAAGICRAIITLGHQLGFTVTAEGVETAAQVSYLRRNDCDFFQGTYFSAPVTADQAFQILRHRYIAHEGIAETPESKTLLLVDDEENILNALSRTLRRDGYTILTAARATDAFDILARHQVQVIISDQRMPDISGTQFLSKVKDLYPETIRLVLSGYTDLASITEAINQGAIYKYLTKPWDDDDLRRQIREAFRNYEMRSAPRNA